MILDVHGGLQEARGDSDRFVHLFGANMKLWYNRWGTDTEIKVNHWGPFDYYQDYNITFPFQFTTDLFYALKRQRFDNNQPRVGINAKFRYLDENSSEDYTENPNGLLGWQHQYEVGSYVRFGF